jgi:hypothetical protein
MYPKRVRGMMVLSGMGGVTLHQTLTHEMVQQFMDASAGEE